MIEKTIKMKIFKYNLEMIAYIFMKNKIRVISFFFNFFFKNLNLSKILL